ncbi:MULTISPECIES: bacteriocin-associated integral membrane family protein [Bacillus cereus group]|uniref:Bacteriocin-associated integral membrane protein n=1 Tax=Bacillus cytotoxicus (strain DSM 22905 / CIP 110041 / 391-98 / NVH 391-98) TaxID=315749 RepID=A7GNK2_BACCN|nr:MULTISPECIES: DUF1430 domain-containing protein [Bacillus cereus group]ABS21710.1 bacteriocin-associated integral membrane protein [Bacillus cytotoxicus NVH 391-98]AWC28326.1 DUF1430 domain-containing protein [Bacillus cytotoxicus]AWC40289.1 DUF1430 domain-containing protein [Bacillus cytotoxicus]AWC44408.1 DUF1430 domain-containing protein [Bacillus cytotoxicus]AWC48220.1 DUF1430 domain-containing protein [Bacillus cytotoxicus]
MRKIIYILFTTLLFLLGIFGLDTFKEYKTNQLLYKNTTSILLNFQDAKPHSENYIAFFQKIAKKYDVSISKYIFTSEKNLTIYTTDVSLHNQVDIKEGTLPTLHSGEFLSTSQSKDKQQSGVIKQIDPQLNMTIKHLDSNTNFSGNGLYYVSTQDKQKIHDLVTELNKEVANAEVFSENHPSMFHFNVSQMIIIGLVILCLYIAIAHYLINRLKELSIIRVFGYSISRIIAHVFLLLTKPIVLASFTGYLLASIYSLLHNGTNYFLYLTCLFWIFTLLFVFTLTIPAIFMIVFLFSNNTNVSKIKGEKPYTLIMILNYGLKLTFIFVLLFSVHQWNELANELNQKLASLSSWKQTKNMYATSVTFNGEHDRKIEYQTGKLIKDFYTKMEKEHKGFLIDASNYYKVNGEYTYHLNANGEDPALSPNGKSITINENYLHYNPIDSVDGTMDKKIIRKKNVMNILVPEKLRKFEKEIKKNYRQHFYFQQVEVENIYNEALGKAKNTTKEQDLSVNVIYVKDHQNYFTYDPNAEVEHNNIVTDPIAIIDTGYFDNSFYLSYVSRCFYFYSDNHDAYSTILPTISNSNVQSSIQHVDSLYDKHGQAIQDLKREKEKITIFIVTLILSNLLLTYNVVATYYQKNKFKLYVQKLFGYSAFARNTSLILLLFAINFIPTISMYVYLGNILPFLTGLFVILLEFVFGTVFDQKISNNTFHSIIKGEH